MKRIWLFFLLLLPLISWADFDVSLEGGAVFCGYNDIRIPGDTGTEYSFCDDLDYKPQAYGRMHLGYQLTKRNYLFFTLAPFTVKAKGSLADTLYFDDQVFAPQEKITSYYNFNSWRLSWRYSIYQTPDWDIALGLTAKIRDAYISVESEDKEAKFSNLGFVPIIHFMVHRKLGEKAGINLTGDALGAPQGRAVDFRLAASYQLSPKLDLDLGYRLLEGGADNDRIYGFALFHYVSLGLRWRI